MSKRGKVGKAVVVLVLCLFWQAANIRFASGMEIVKDGVSTCSIIIAEKATEAEKFAASELQTYLQKMSGATVPISKDVKQTKGNKILIGKTLLTDKLGIKVKTKYKGKYSMSEPFIVKTVRNSLCLLGKGDRGTVYSVYSFLENDLGVRWYAPDELGEEVPSMKDIVISDIDRLEVPSFEFRNLGVDPLWRLRNRMNVNLYELAKKCGGCISWSGGHSHYRLIPPKEYFDSHPEYFALVKGKRNPKTEICTTNPDVIEICAKKVIEYFNRNPEALSFSLAPNDWKPWCECERCKAVDEEQIWDDFYGEKRQSTSKRNSLFANEIAKRLAKHHPDKMVHTYCYHHYVEPPKTLKLEKNVMAVVCHHRFCYAHPIGSPECPMNMRFDRFLRKWVSISDYVIVYQYPWKTIYEQLPWPMLYQINADLKHFKEIGVKGICGQSNDQLWGNLGLNYYLIAKLLWNADLNLDKILNDYFQGYFRESAEPMRKYYLRQQEALRQANVHINWKPKRQAPVFLTCEVMEECKGYLDKAKQLAKSERVKKRVERVYIAFHYADLWLKAVRAEQELMSMRTGNPQQTVGEIVRYYDELLRYVGGVKDKRALLISTPHKWLSGSTIPVVIELRLKKWQEYYQKIIGEPVTQIPLNWKFRIDPEDKGLVALWHFDENQGTTVKDATGNNNTGTIHGATWIEEGIKGSALQFQKPGYVEIPWSKSLDLSSAMTISFWFKRGDFKGWEPIVEKQDCFRYRVTSKNSKGIFFIQDIKLIATETTILPFIWTYVTLTADKKAVKIYVNGELDVAGQGWQGIKKSKNPIWLAKMVLADGSNRYWEGLIDEVRIYNRALSKDEVKALFNASNIL